VNRHRHPISLHQPGYTLVEILVVLIVVATLSGLIIIRVGQFGTAPPAQQLDRLATLLHGWCQQAVFQQRNLAVRIRADGYDFWEPDTAVNNVGEVSTNWRVSSEEVYSEQLWEGAMRAQLLVSGQVTELDLQVPQLRCYASGQMTPFSLRLSEMGQALHQASLQADSNGRLKLQN